MAVSFAGVQYASSNSGVYGNLYAGAGFCAALHIDLQLLITLAATGLGYILLQYVIEMITYYFTYGRAYSDTAKKRVTYIQKLRRQPLGFFSSKESGELISSFANDFSNVEYTLCYWLPYPIGVGSAFGDFHCMDRHLRLAYGDCHVWNVANLRGNYVRDCPNQRKTQQAGHGCKNPCGYANQ